jgi:hypothetical protein
MKPTGSSGNGVEFTKISRRAERRKRRFLGLIWARLDEHDRADVVDREEQH